jgi:hypothetical protein
MVADGIGSMRSSHGQYIATRAVQFSHGRTPRAFAEDVVAAGGDDIVVDDCGEIWTDLPSSGIARRTHVFVVFHTTGTGGSDEADD